MLGPKTTSSFQKEDEMTIMVPSDNLGHWKQKGIDLKRGGWSARRKWERNRVGGGECYSG